MITYADPDIPQVFHICQADGRHDQFTDDSWLALTNFAQVRQVFDTTLAKRSGLSIREIAIAYLGLLCTGKSDFAAIETHRNDGCFAETLSSSGTPAASTLRMQLDARAEQIIPLVEQLSVNLLKASKAPITIGRCSAVASSSCIRPRLIGSPSIALPPSNGPRSMSMNLQLRENRAAKKPVRGNFMINKEEIWGLLNMGYGVSLAQLAVANRIHR